MATGGIGGVHRGAETTMDISADLEELAQTPVMVVCAGAKAILDLGLTLEYLETHGVTVIGYGTSELPAFYTRKSGFGVDYELDTPEQLAKRSTSSASWVCAAAYSSRTRFPKSTPWTRKSSTRPLPRPSRTRRRTASTARPRRLICSPRSRT